MDSDYLPDYPPVMFTTFKAILTKKEETKTQVSPKSSCPGERNAATQSGAKDTLSTIDLTPSDNATYKAISKKPEGSLKEQTYRWFEKTQRPKLMQSGAFPDWFQGFTTRRRAEDMLQDMPLGTYLIRFCESRVGFVLSYRGTERCRHFTLDQLSDERYVIEGEESAHPQLQDLLEHYCKHPVNPYKEVLTRPWSKKTKTQDSRNNFPTVKEEQMYSSIQKEARATVEAADSLSTSPKDRKDFTYEGKMQAQNTSQSYLTKALTVPQKGPSTCALAEDHVAPQGLTRKTSGNRKQCVDEVSFEDQKYAALEMTHTYAEPATCLEQRTNNTNDETIAFYAMGRGSCKDNLENFYSEVDTNCRVTCDMQSRTHRQVTCATLPHHGHQPLQNSAPTFHSSLRVQKWSTSPKKNHTMAWGNSAKLFSTSKTSQQNHDSQYDDLTYGNNAMRHGSHRPVSNTDDDLENIYEKIPEVCALKPRKNHSTRHKTS